MCQDFCMHQMLWNVIPTDELGAKNSPLLKFKTTLFADISDTFFQYIYVVTTCYCSIRKYYT